MGKNNEDSLCFAENQYMLALKKCNKLFNITQKATVHLSVDNFCRAMLWRQHLPGSPGYIGVVKFFL